MINKIVCVFFFVIAFEIKCLIHVYYKQFIQFLQYGQVLFELHYIPI